jgi:hypothetical protein
VRLNSFKTDGLYKAYETPLSAELSAAIKLYHHAKQSTNGTLFETTDATILSNRISRMNVKILPMLKVTCESNCSINYVRHMKVAEFYNTKGVNDPVERIKLEKIMNHSSVMQSYYKRMVKK